MARLRDAGSRILFGYSNGVGDKSRFPQDLLRIQRQFFSCDDQPTLAHNTRLNPEPWALAREAGVPIISHIGGTDFSKTPGARGRMGPGNEYIHCTGPNNAIWSMIADTGGKVSIAPVIEMQMGQDMPFQDAIDRGIAISLSSDGAEPWKWRRWVAQGRRILTSRSVR